ncbi:hypothetical protein ACFLXY_07045 [Chloroflexota bacterium]
MRSPSTIEISSGDIYFLISTIDPDLLKSIDFISNDPEFIESMMEKGAVKAFHRIMLFDENELTTSISPRFLFEVLLRTARFELKNRGYTIERSSSMKVPVFDSQDVVDFMEQREVIRYLADMLTSFTKIQSYSITIRVRKGFWRRIRFNDMDIDSLMRYCQTVEEESRFKIYKRIADLCLFLLGIFPEYVTPVLSSSFPGNTGSRMFGRMRRSAQEYAEEGKRFYKLAAEHGDSSKAGLAEALRLLHEQFDLAGKPLNYISENLIQFKKVTLFPS